MMIITYLLTLILFSFTIAIGTSEKQLTVKKRINSFVPSEAATAREKNKIKPALKGKSILPTNKLRTYFGIKVSSEQEEDMQKKLLQAGSPFNMTVVDYYITNMIIRFAVPLLFAAYGRLLGLTLKGIMLLTLAGVLLAIKALDFYINGKIKSRYRKALRELPDFLDLLTICVEAGLGFDLALNRVITKKSGILSSEFFICLEEMRLGKTRKEALIGVRERLNFDGIRSLINSIIQAEKLGVSIVQILRTKSEDERDKRKQRAEEMAMKTSIKILFPLICFIFPSIFIVILGPMGIELLKAFSKAK